MKALLYQFQNIISLYPAKNYIHYTTFGCSSLKDTSAQAYIKQKTYRNKSNQRG